MPKFFVDFEFAGHIEIAAQTEEEAKEQVENIRFDELIEHIQHFNIGLPCFQRKQAELFSLPNLRSAVLI